MILIISYCFIVLDILLNIVITLKSQNLESNKVIIIIIIIIIITIIIIIIIIIIINSATLLQRCATSYFGLHSAYASFMRRSCVHQASEAEYQALQKGCNA